MLPSVTASSYACSAAGHSPSRSTSFAPCCLPDPDLCLAQQLCHHGPRDPVNAKGTRPELLDSGSMMLLH